MAAYSTSEDLIRIGAYQKGSDPVLDQALVLMPSINRFLEQTPAETVNLAETLEKLEKING